MALKRNENMFQWVRTDSGCRTCHDSQKRGHAFHQRVFKVRFWVQDYVQASAPNTNALLSFLLFQRFVFLWELSVPSCNVNIPTQGVRENLAVLIRQGSTRKWIKKGLNVSCESMAIDF